MCMQNSIIHPLFSVHMYVQTGKLGYTEVHNSNTEFISTYVCMYTSVFCSLQTIPA